jgi:hypothetical protein
MDSGRDAQRRYAALRCHLLPDSVTDLLPVLAGLAVSGAVVPLIHLLLVLELLTVNTVPGGGGIARRRFNEHA